MDLYQCVIDYRVGTYNSDIHSKTLYIQADCGLTAWAYCKKISQGWGNGQVYYPKVTRVVIPEPDATLTLEDVKRKYGTELVKEAIEDTEFLEFRYDDKSRGIKYGEIINEI